MGAKNFLLNYTSLDKITLVENGFNERPKCRNKFENFTVCFHGILGEFQDVDGLLTVGRLLKREGIDFIVIGYGKKEHLLESADEITFLGRKSPEATLEIVERCHLGISLRTNDEISRNSFPVKVWEYVGMSLPCIISPISEAGIFVENYGLGAQFEFGEYEEILKKILEFKSGLWKVKDSKALSNFNRSSTGRAAAEAIHNYFEGQLI